MIKTVRRLVLAAAFSGLALSGAAAQSNLRIGLAEDPDVLDPTLARTYVGRIVFSSICDKLFDIDEKLNIVPQLATSHETSADGLTVVFESSASNLVSGDFNAKLKSFADSVYRKFESLGNWSIDHQMMLNSFLQERFLMANLVKNANLEIEKAKTISLKRDESFKRYESEIGVL